MEFLLDTANLEDIKRYINTLPITGVTSNPSIIKKEGTIDFFEHMNTIRSIIGPERSLHVQVVSTDYEGMMRDAHTILERIDSDVYIKIPTNEVGLKVMRDLKANGVNVTATAIYTTFQAYLAIAAKADYIAPYINRMENLNIDSHEAISQIALEISRTQSTTKILAASFKNVKQVTTALECGAHASTMGCDIINLAFDMPSINKAIDDFTNDWESIFGPNKKIHNL